MFLILRKDKGNSNPWQPGIHFDVESLSHVLQKKALSSHAVFVKLKPEGQGER